MLKNAIVFSTDNNYVKFVYIVITSILKNAHQKSMYDFYIIEDGHLTVENINILKDLEKHNININFLRVDQQRFESCPTFGHWSINCYYRYLLPELLPNLDRALYLDCDVMVRDDISELFKIDFEKNYAIAVKDTPRGEETHKKRLEFDSEIPYINTGVLLLNLKKCREDNVVAELFDNTIKIKDKIVVVDQDVINWTLKGNVKIIDRKYNLLDDCGWIDKSVDAKIFHFGGSAKPWEKYNFAYFLHYGHEYFTYVKDTPFQELYTDYIIKKQSFEYKKIKLKIALQSLQKVKPKRAWLKKIKRFVKGIINGK